MPPGVIGGHQAQLRPELQGYFQPVHIVAPETALVAVAEGGTFGHDDLGSALVGLQVGEVYRLRISEIPHESAAVYPTIELLDRLHPPPGKETRFPVPIEITQEELEMALSGRYVIRVIYVEDPQLALPARQVSEQRYIEVLPDEDPLQVAGEHGRPIAILRLGSRVPGPAGPDAVFLFGSPPLTRHVAPVAAEYEPSAATLDDSAIVPQRQPARPEQETVPNPQPEEPRRPVEQRSPRADEPTPRMDVFPDTIDNAPEDQNPFEVEDPVGTPRP
jgi:hypothetical protein